MLPARSSVLTPSVQLIPRTLWIVLALAIFPAIALGQQSQFVAADPTLAAEALAEAEALDLLEEPTAVDFYFEASAQAAKILQQFPAALTGDTDVEIIYRDALEGLIDASQRYGRLDAHRQRILVGGGTRVVPISYFGFAWRPQDFSLLLPAHYERNTEIANHYISGGIGTPLIAERVTNQQIPFSRQQQNFAVTALLRPATNASNDFVLELYNPLVFDRVNWGGFVVPIARDLSAPLAREINEAPRQYLRGFTSPSDTSVRPLLMMLEPYQRGKIPVVFIHGLYSDPTTWADMLNELRAQHDLYAQYQFWIFRYPTGGNLLASAAALRQQLYLVRNQFDPQHIDPALDAMVLVGHSLGGLVSKMQITSSNDQFWGRIAQQPYSALRAPFVIQQKFAQSLFFQPVPTVKRVVFIGTPHRGSDLTRRLAGRIGSALVSFGSEEDVAYQQLIDSNREVFRPDFSDEPPTSISLLEPDSPFLEGLANMPLNSETHVHSIIGDDRGPPFAEPGDGVVTVESARHCGESELFVPAKHEKLHRNPESINEVARILRLHAGTSL